MKLTEEIFLLLEVPVVLGARGCGSGFARRLFSFLATASRSTLLLKILTLIVVSFKKKVIQSKNLLHRLWVSDIASVSIV